MKLNERITRARWRIASAVAPKMRARPRSADQSAIFPLRDLLESIGHRVTKASGGDTVMLSVLDPMFSPSPTPYHARIAISSVRARRVLIGVLRMIDPDIRVTVVLGAKTNSTLYFDPRSLRRIEPRIHGDPIVAPPDGRYISPRSGRDICHYCHTAQGKTIDHIVPVSFGSLDVWWNRVSACRSCNEKKANDAPTCPCDHCRRAVDLFLAGYREG